MHHCDRCYAPIRFVTLQRRKVMYDLDKDRQHNCGTTRTERAVNKYMIRKEEIRTGKRHF